MAATRRLSGVKTWALYYGTTRPAGLQAYDLAVVAPEGWDKPSVAALKSRGTVAMAYLPVLEQQKRAGSPAPSNVLVVDGKPMEQPLWHTWVLDPRHELTEERVLHMAEALVAQGFDGFFLDTVGDVENVRLLPARLRFLLVPAAARIVAALRHRYPDRPIIQNWGLGALLDLTQQHIDGVCWEDFPTGYPDAWQEQLALRLSALADQGLKVFALNQQPSETPPPLATRLGFCWYGAPSSYTLWR